MKKTIAFILFLSVLLLTVSCAGDTQRIIGSWTAQEKVIDTIITETRYTFNEDGTGKLRTVLGIEINMKYAVDEENKTLTITTSTLGIEKSDVYTYKLKSGELLLTKDGKETVCKRYVADEKEETNNEA